MAKQRFMVGNGDYQELETYFVERRPESIFFGLRKFCVKT